MLSVLLRTLIGRNTYLEEKVEDRSSSVPAPRPRTPPQPWEGLSGASDDQWSRGSWDFED